MKSPIFTDEVIELVYEQLTRVNATQANVVWTDPEGLPVLVMAIAIKGDAPAMARAVESADCPSSSGDMAVATMDARTRKGVLTLNGEVLKDDRVSPEVKP